MPRSKNCTRAQAEAVTRVTDVIFRSQAPRQVLAWDGCMRRAPLTGRRRHQHPARFSLAARCSCLRVTSGKSQLRSKPHLTGAPPEPKSSATTKLRAATSSQLFWHVTAFNESSRRLHILTRIFLFPHTACTVKSVGRTTNAKCFGYLRNAASGRLFSHAVFPQVYALQRIAARFEFASHVH